MSKRKTSAQHSKTVKPTIDMDEKEVQPATEMEAGTSRAE